MTVIVLKGIILEETLAVKIWSLRTPWGAECSRRGTGHSVGATAWVSGPAGHGPRGSRRAAVLALGPAPGRGWPAGVPPWGAEEAACRPCSYGSQATQRGGALREGRERSQHEAASAWGRRGSPTRTHTLNSHTTQDTRAHSHPDTCAHTARAHRHVRAGHTQTHTHTQTFLGVSCNELQAGPVASIK